MKETSLPATYTSLGAVFYILLSLSSHLFAQNLVPNPSFEDTVQCPNGPDQVHYATGWSSYSYSSDYFNACNLSGGVSVPYNFGGYQHPAKGNAYCGFTPYYSSALIFNSYREYIGRGLSAPLVIGTKYFVSFKVSLAYNAGSASCASNNIGAKFSTVPYDLYATDSITTPLVNNFAHIFTTSVITDTANWTIISGAFIADSTYNYVLIANFFKDANTDTLILNSNNICYSYYYVDDICVSMDSLTCGVTNVNEIQLQNPVEIYPNPFNQ